MIKTLALVLKKQNLGETDRILTVFSPSLGKKRVVARAIRKPLSKLAGHLDTFMLSQIILTEDAELPKVAGAVVIEAFEYMRESLSALNRAFAVSRIVERVILEDVSQQAIFQLMLDTLVRLNHDESWRGVWLFFLYRLTDCLGLQTTELHCQTCGRELREAAHYLPDERHFICAECFAGAQASIPLTRNSVKLLHLMKKQNYATIARINIP